MKLLIAGDLTLQNRAVQSLWDNNQLEKSFLCVKSVLNNCDWAVVNLESPITESKSPILKDGPSLKNPLSILDIIEYCGFNAVTLANNHLKDYGSKGVEDTLNALRGKNVETIGVGRSISEARKPLIVKSEDIKIGVMNVCEHESSIVSNNVAGANPLDWPYLFQDITELKNHVDKILLIIHGGREHYQLPTPRMKREYKMLLDFGADVIVNHHQHCFSGYEIYKGKPIFYGLGNFFFDRPKCRNEKWNYGFMVELNIEKEKISFSMIPYEQCNDDIVIKIWEYESFKQQIEKLNYVIADDRLIDEEYKKLVASAKMLAPFIPFGNRVLRSLYYRNILPNFMSKKNMSLIENYVSCETHRELLLEFLKNRINR